jgi:hypothetical protein
MPFASRHGADGDPESGYGGTNDTERATVSLSI